MYRIKAGLIIAALLWSGMRLVDCALDTFTFEELISYTADDDIFMHVPQVLVISIIVLITIPIRRLVNRNNVTVNERLLWLVLAAIFGALLYLNTKRRWLDVTWAMAPRQLLAIYMPISIFKTAYMIDLHTLKRSIVQVLIVGVVCVIINASLLSTILMYIIRDNGSSWSRAMGFICGAACTPIEMSPFLYALNDFEKYKHLITILEGEELFASVTALCMFEVALGFHQNYLVMWYQPVLVIFRLIAFGLLFGVLMGLAISWVIRILNDALNVIMVTIIGTFMAWYISEYTLAFSGCITCAVVGMFMAKEKASMSIEVDLHVNIFWNVLSDIITTICLISLLGMMFDRLAVTSQIHMYPPVFCTYALSGLARLLSLLLMAPILSRTGYGMDFRSMLLLVWANTKGPLPLILGLIVFHYKDMKLWGTHIIAHITGVCILCIILNGSTLEMLLKLFGFMELSNVRKSNMNNCMKFLQEKRDSMISVLKMNRFLSDANWPVVINSTILQHPYKLKITIDEEDTFLWGNRESICPTCKKNINIAPTAKELKDMIMEARMRVLKTQRISYIRQYESGMLSKVGIRSLLQAVEVAIDSTEPIIKLDEYYKLIKNKHANEWYKILTIKLLRKLKCEFKIPMGRYPTICYNCITSRLYTMIYVIVILTNIFYIIVSKLVYSSNHSISTGYVAGMYNYSVLIFYLADMVARIMAYSYDSYWTGVKQYFRGIFNIIDCIVIMLYITMVVRRFYTGEYYHDLLICIICFRLCRLCNIHSNLVSKLIQLYEKRIDLKVVFAYDVGKALVTGFEESIDVLSQMVENKTVRDSIKKQIEDDRLIITKELGMIQKDSPWIAISIKTKQATRATLNHMRSAVTDLKMSGFVDEFEYDKLKDSIEESLKQERLLKVVTISSPKRLFREVQWTGLHNDVADFLYDNISTQIWDTGDIIVKCGKKPDALYVLVTGLFRISYTPEKRVLNNLYKNGALPIMDYIPSSKFEESLEEFIFSGNSMGELCLLTDRPYNSTVIAEAPSQAFILSHKLMQEAMERDKNPINGLESRIWKYISITLACEILQETPLYQSMTQEEVRLMLVRSFVPNLSCYKIFIINELIQDVVLIEGTIMDFNTRTYFVAPCYIPRTVPKMVMPISDIYTRDKTNSVRVKLLIIPGKDIDEMDVMDKTEDLSDLVSNPSNSCLVPKTYGKKMKRRKRLTQKAKEEEKRRRGEKVFSVPEAEDEWVAQAMGVQVIDDEAISVTSRRHSLTSYRSDEKSSEGSSNSTRIVTELSTSSSIKSNKSISFDHTEDVIRLRRKSSKNPDGL